MPLSLLTLNWVFLCFLFCIESRVADRVKEGPLAQLSHHGPGCCDCGFTLPAWQCSGAAGLLLCFLGHLSLWKWSPRRGGLLQREAIKWQWGKNLAYKPSRKLGERSLITTNLLNFVIHMVPWHCGEFSKDDEILKTCNWKGNLICLYQEARLFYTHSEKRQHFCSVDVQWLYGRVLNFWKC